MIAGIFHEGSGIGNQLFRYVATRVLAYDKGVEFGMVAPELFKGGGFMFLDTGAKVKGGYNIHNGGRVELVNPDFKTWEENTPYYNPGINFVEDNTIIDGNFEDPRYFEHGLNEVDKWLKVEPIEVPDDVCVIGFRGGEYTTVPDLYLPERYWREAIAKMILENPQVRKFEVHTDDPVTADSIFLKMGFPPAIHDVGVNWRSMRYAKYAIIANSSFYILPRLLNGGLTIAPKYWNRYNLKRWDFPQNYYKQFTYIHHEKA